MGRNCTTVEHNLLVILYKQHQICLIFTLLSSILLLKKKKSLLGLDDLARILVLAAWIAILFFAMNSSPSNYWNPFSQGSNFLFVMFLLQQLNYPGRRPTMLGSRYWRHGLQYCFLHCIRHPQIAGISHCGDPILCW